MPVYIALLRGINVSGQKKIKMADLRKALEASGFRNVDTYIQSGNIFLRSEEKDPKAVAQSISSVILDAFGLDVITIVLLQDQLHAILLNNPFIKERNEDIDKLYVTFLADTPDPEKLEAIDASQYAPEEFIPGKSHLYFFSPKGYGNAKMNNNFFEKKLGVAGTTRNWKTVRKLWERSFGR